MLCNTVLLRSVTHSVLSSDPMFDAVVLHGFGHVIALVVQQSAQNDSKFTLSIGLELLETSKQLILRLQRDSNLELEIIINEAEPVPVL